MISHAGAYLVTKEKNSVPGLGVKAIFKLPSPHQSCISPGQAREGLVGCFCRLKETKTGCWYPRSGQTDDHMSDVYVESLFRISRLKWLATT